LEARQNKSEMAKIEDVVLFSLWGQDSKKHTKQNAYGRGDQRSSRPFCLKFFRLGI
jgi:hypothetical protein